MINNLNVIVIFTRAKKLTLYKQYQHQKQPTKLASCLRG